MAARDQLTDQHLSAVMAGLEAVALVPPDDLTGPARVMFEAIAANNRTRPWNQSHAYALANYCRVASMWETEMQLIVTEGTLVAGKPNPRFRVAQLLSADRLRIGKILGLHMGSRDTLLAGHGKAEARAREIGAAYAASAGLPEGDLLA